MLTWAGLVDRVIEELLAAVLLLALQRPGRPGAILADLQERRRVRVQGPGGDARAMRDRVDVAGRALPDDARAKLALDARVAHPDLPLEHCSLKRRQCDVRVSVIVIAGGLSRHPAEHPDVEPGVLEHQPVAPAAAIAHDERLPEIGA